MHHVTVVIYLFIIQEIKEKKRKREIKSKKIDKNKIKSKYNPRVQVHHNNTLLFSLLPPSCIIAPIRELVNIQFSTSSFNFKSLQIANLPS